MFLMKNMYAMFISKFTENVRSKSVLQSLISLQKIRCIERIIQIRTAIYYQITIKEYTQQQQQQQKYTLVISLSVF